MYLIQMNPPPKMFANQPPPPPSFQAIRKRKSQLEKQFEKDYPFFKFTLRNVSVRFLIPLHELKTIFDDKNKVLKLIYQKIDLEKR
jgi:hypothetical protein